VERLKAIAALEKAKATDEAAYKFDFIKLAKQRADENGVPASAFREMGVAADVLAAAGIDGQPRAGAVVGPGPAPHPVAPLLVRVARW
jgi:hypothetical protein